MKHSMIVAVDSEQGDGKNAVVGFLEVGLLPSPVSDTTVVIRDSDTDNEYDGEIYGSSSLEKEDKQNDIENITKRERKTDAETMILINDNSVSTVESADLNGKEGNSLLNIDSKEIDDGSLLDPNILVLQAAAVVAEQKRQRNREEVPYLGNVAVSRESRYVLTKMKMIMIV